jgi:hypothetical protein
MNHGGARRMLACGELVEDRRGDAGTHEHRRQSKPGGPRANNQDIGISSVCSDSRLHKKNSLSNQSVQNMFILLNLMRLTRQYIGQPCTITKIPPNSGDCPASQGLAKSMLLTL